MVLLDIQNVRKQYDGHLAISNVTLQIPKGVIYGLLGPNGAGKTTLIRMINGITKPDEGRIELNGREITGVLNENIGYLPEERGLYKKMKVAEQLVYLARLKGLSQVQALEKVRFWLEKFDMMDWRRRHIDELSKGMQQKIQFIATVQHEPDLIILDEPFTGLDPVNTNLIKDEIRDLQSQGKSIIFSTHRMEQVEEICERIALINMGTNILEGEVREIKQKNKEGLFSLSSSQPLNGEFLERLELVSHTTHDCVFKIDERWTTRDILQLLVEYNIPMTRFEEILPSLNDVFIKTVSP